MTELEAVEAANAVYANAQTSFTIFFTVVSAYLAVALLVGKSLTRFQVGVVTTLFLVIAGTALAAFAAFMEVALHYTSIELQMRDSADRITRIVARSSVWSIATVADFCLVLVSLWFMWDVRHPKRQ